MFEYFKKDIEFNICPQFLVKCFISDAGCGQRQNFAAQ